jgi:hypothetical protein
MKKQSFCKSRSVGLSAIPRFLCGAGSGNVAVPAPHAGMNLFLYEKVGRRAIVPVGCISETGSTSEAGGRAQAPVPTPTPKDGIPKGRVPAAPLAAQLRIWRSRIPKCVVKQRTAVTRGQRPRGLSPYSAQVQARSKTAGGRGDSQPGRGSGGRLSGMSSRLG